MKSIIRNCHDEDSEKTKFQKKYFSKVAMNHTTHDISLHKFGYRNIKS